MTFPPPSVLLGEDNPEDVFLIKLAIAECGIEVNLQVFERGTEMLRVLAEERLTPNCVLLDLNLAGAGGLEILSYIRQREKLAHIPVVILTSSESKQDSRNSFQCGATKYIQKPSSLDEFLAIGGVIRELLETTKSVSA